MTKNKKNLTWKLKEQPSGHVVAELVAAGVLKPEEARDILFGNSENDKDKIEALEKLVEFLQGLVTDLSKNRSGTTFIPYTQTVYIDRGARPYWDKYWMNTNKILCKAGIDMQSSTLTTSGTGGTINATSIANSSSIKSATYANADYSGFTSGSMNVNEGKNAITLSVSKNDIIS